MGDESHVSPALLPDSGNVAEQTSIAVHTVFPTLCPACVAKMGEVTLAIVLASLSPLGDESHVNQLASGCPLPFWQCNKNNFPTRRSSDLHVVFRLRCQGGRSDTCHRLVYVCSLLAMPRWETNHMSASRR